MGNSAGPKITKDGLVLDFDAANPKSYNFYADSYASNVSLHLKMDGANGSTTFTDSSPNALAVTAAGNAQISTTQSKYNGTSAYFNGSTGYLSLTGNSSFQFGTGDFTVEAWVYIAANASSQQTFLDTRGAATVAPFTFGIYQSKLFFYDGTVIQSSATITSGQWYHFAACRSAGNLQLFINGISYYNASNTTNITTGANSIYIGRGFDVAAYYTNGYIDELKVTKGVARYTSAFTSPPIPSTCTDLTRSKNVGTLTGGVDYNFSNGGSLAFATSYVSSPSANAYQLGANNFTMESWIYLNAYPLASNGFYTAMIMCKDQLGSRGFNFSITGSSSANTALLFGGFSDNSTAQSAAPSFPFQLNTWYHVAASRIGNLLYMYVNGNLLNAGGTSFTTTIQSTTSEVRIGAQVYSGGYNYYVNGRIAIMKLYNGKGLTSAEVYNNFVANRGRFGV
jgi:hypothetical protein